MDRSTENGTKVAGFDPQGCVAFLRARHPLKTATAVAAATGDPRRTVENWLAGVSAPSVFAIGRLFSAYGAPFAAAAFPGLAFLREAAALASYEGLGREIDRLRARRSELGARLLSARPEAAEGELR